MNATWRLWGFLTFLDRPKEGVADAIADLAGLGVSIKLITGDSELVARHVATLVGLRFDRVLTGRQLDELHDEALWRVSSTLICFLFSTIRLIVVTFAIPYLPFGRIRLRAVAGHMLVAAISGITVLSVVATELTKRRLSVMRA